MGLFSAGDLWVHSDRLLVVSGHCRCPHTVNTRRLLIEEGGFLYDSDAYDDDLPRFFEVAGRDTPHVVVPHLLREHNRSILAQLTPRIWS